MDGRQGQSSFLVTSLKADAWRAKPLYEKLYCARGEMENRIKECQGDLFADRTSTATMRANQLRLWFASMAYALLCAMRRIGLAHTPFATATCGTIRLKLLKLGALVKISARRVRIAFASACPYARRALRRGKARKCARLANLTRVAAARQCFGSRRGFEVIPLTYMNSTAAIKAFCGERGGLVCTSSNARAAFGWAFARGKRDSLSARPAPRPQHRLRHGHPARRDGRLGSVGVQRRPAPDAARGQPILLWKGHCSVHQRFLPSHVDPVRAKYPGIQVIVHPECRWEVCQKADALGSTERLIALVEKAPEGSMFAVGTEIHLVNRLARGLREGKRIITLDDTGCLCTTMYRISPQHLAWALENLVEGRVVNRIQVARREALGPGRARPDAGDRRSRTQGAVRLKHRRRRRRKGAHEDLHTRRSERAAAGGGGVAGAGDRGQGRGRAARRAKFSPCGSASFFRVV